MIDKIIFLEVTTSICLLAPFFCFLLIALDGLISGHTNERRIGGWSRAAAGLQFSAAVGIFIEMLERNFIPFHFQVFRFLPIFVDWRSLIYISLTGFVGWIVISYSERYMHREPNFRRFFLCLQLFLGGTALIVLGGTLDWLFAGWEIVGLASFLLIGFYSERSKAARHAMRAFLTYRLCDVGLLVGAILMHSIFHTGLFEVTEGARHISLVGQGFENGELLFLCVLLFIAAAGKSAQFPFSGWLSRAMEGPTPSTAVFYGCLSIHAGVFLLARTEGIWMQSEAARLILFGVGAVSFLQSRLVMMVQPTVKGRIAWAAISHVGVIFCELAVDFHGIAFSHMVFNALYRCYQLLASPSTVAQHFRENAPVTTTKIKTDFGGLMGLFARKIYMAALNEFYVDLLFNRFVASRFRYVAARSFKLKDRFFKIALPSFDPMRNLGWMDGFSTWFSAAVLLCAITVVIGPFPFDTGVVQNVLVSILWLMALGGIILMGDLRQSIRVRLNLGFIGFVFLIVAAFLLSGPSSSNAVLATLSGLSIGMVGFNLSVKYMQQRKSVSSVDGFWGFSTIFPRCSTIMLISMLALITFPITAAFQGEDKILELCFAKSHGMTVVGGVTAIAIQLQMIRVLAEAYFGAPGLEIRFKRLDLQRNWYATYMSILVALCAGSFYLL